MINLRNLTILIAVFAAATVCSCGSSSGTEKKCETALDCTMGYTCNTATGMCEKKSNTAEYDPDQTDSGNGGGSGSTGDSGDSSDSGLTGYAGKSGIICDCFGKEYDIPMFAASAGKEWCKADEDGDGIANCLEVVNGAAVDTDLDGIKDYQDTDSDGDGIPDSQEGTKDSDGDGIYDYRDEDSDGDRLLDKFECPELPCVDTDGDGIPDYLDTDSDNDGIPDLYEGSDDPDKDDVRNYRDTDSDGDGVSDTEENGGVFPPLDSDGDGKPDFLDTDSDGDGLSDKVEYEIGSDPRNSDSDGDGYDDYSEHLLGSDPNDATSMISEDAFYVLLPYKGEPDVRNLKFSTNIQKVDVLILVDLSGSMIGEHDNLKAGIKTTIIDGVRAKISDSAFGLVKFGTLESKTYSLAQPITMDADAVKSAVDGISDCGGSEEYHNFALWAAASGEYKYEDICYSKNVFGSCRTESVTSNPPDCSAYPGNIGGACFRSESLPIFIMASDESFGDGSWKSWESGSRTTRDMAIAKMNAINAKFIGLDSGSSMSDFNYISDGTGSNNGAGTRFNFSVKDDGTGFSQAIVDAVVSLTNNIQIDITAKAKSVDNPEGIDSSKFVKSISPEGFYNVKPGQQVTFDVTFENDFYKNDSYESKVFTASISVLGDGAFLDMRDVIVVVPGIDYTGNQE